MRYTAKLYKMRMKRLNNLYKFVNHKILRYISVYYIYLLYTYSSYMYKHTLSHITYTYNKSYNIKLFF